MIRVHAGGAGGEVVGWLTRPRSRILYGSIHDTRDPQNVLICRIECTSVMSGLGGAPAVLPAVDAGRCRRRTGRGSGRCGGTAGPRSGRPGRGGVGPFAWVPADLGYGGREARRSSIWRARPALAWRDDLRENAGALDGVLAGKGKNFSFRGCIRRPMDILPANVVYRRIWRTASQEGWQFPADDKGKEISLLATSNVWRTGGLAARPGSGRSIAGRTKNGRRHGATTCVCCCRRTGAVANRWWDWRCGCGRWAGSARVRAARLVGEKAARDEDVPNKRFDTARDAGDSTGQCRATEHGCCLGGIAMIEQSVLGLQEVDEMQAAVVGGKGAHLGGLSRIDGIRVPAGFCVTTDAFRRIMAEAPSIDDRLDQLSRLNPDDREAIRTLSAEIPRTLEEIAIPGDLAAAVTLWWAKFATV